MKCVYLKFHSAKNQSGQVKVEDLPPIMVKLKALSENFNVEEIRAFLRESHSNMNGEIDFESFLRVSLNGQGFIEFSFCILYVSKQFEFCV